ncbi:hypothetical protein [Agromyces sp. NPDC058126]|uniref:hypothetical protein n=1 Tax=Agromyces sp. NPDC058126 TaxID=3346350 RepID=UPI0036DF2FE0
MDPTIASLVGTLVITTAGSFLGAFTSHALIQRRTESAFRKKRRLEASGQMLEALRTLEGMLRDRECMTAGDWVNPIRAFYEAADDAAYVLPEGLRHVKRSVRAALGEALGIVTAIDLRGGFADGERVTDFDEWRGYAADYLAGCSGQLRNWRDSGRSSVSMLTYDAWLRQAGLHSESFVSPSRGVNPRAWAKFDGSL